MDTIAHVHVGAYLSRLLRTGEDGQADVVLILLLAFLVAVLVAGRRIIVQ